MPTGCAPIQLRSSMLPRGGSAILPGLSQGGLDDLLASAQSFSRPRTFCEESDIQLPYATPSIFYSRALDHPIGENQRGYLRCRVKTKCTGPPKPQLPSPVAGRVEGEASIKPSVSKPFARHLPWELWFLSGAEAGIESYDERSPTQYLVPGIYSSSRTYLSMGDVVG